MTTLDFDKTIWTPAGEGTDETVRWHDGNGVQLIVQSLGIDQNLRSRLASEASVREYYRDVYAAQGIGIIQCDLVTISGFGAAITIGKKVTRGKPAIYAGSLALPLPDKSFVLSLYSQEVGITGLRDTAVFSLLSSQGSEFQLDEKTGKMIGWARDPYFPDYEGPCLRNQSEDQGYDSQFPDHPLSKVRVRLLELTQSVALQNVTHKKPWWKLW